MTTSSRSRKSTFLLPLAASLIAIFWALSYSRFHMLGPFWWKYSTVAYSIAHGLGPANLDDQTPIGYSLLLVPLILIGLPAIDAGWIVSLLALGALTGLVFYWVGKRCGPLAASFAVLLLLAQPSLLSMANKPQSDSAFFLSAMLAAVVTEWLCEQPADNKLSKRLIPGLVTGVVLSLTYWLRYIGLLMVALGLCRLFTRWLRTRDPALLISQATVIFCTLPAAIRQLHLVSSSNPSFTDNRLLHPGDSLASVLIQALFNIGHDWLPIVGRISYWPWQILVSVVVAALITLLAARSLRKPGCILPALFLFTYVPSFCLLASRARLDLMNSRFMDPIYPFISSLLTLYLWDLQTRKSSTVPMGKTILVAALFVVALMFVEDALWHCRWQFLFPLHVELYRPATDLMLAAGLIIWSGIATVLRSGSFWSNRSTTASIVTIAIVLLSARSAFSPILSSAPQTAGHSPETMGFLLKTCPNGARIVGNQDALEIQTWSARFVVVGIPWSDPWNGDLNAHYGIFPWTRQSALQQFAKSQAQFVVVCYSDRGTDTLIGDGNYGAYIPLLLRGNLPEVKKVSTFNDGIVVQLAELSVLQRELQITQSASSTGEQKRS